jgi:putative membrane protein
MRTQPIRTLVSIAVAVALAGGAAWAQSATQGTTQPPAAADRMAPASKASATTPSRMGSAQAKASSAQDRKFVATAGEAGAAEVEMARVAMDRAQSSDVKNFASRMVSDHEKAGEDLDKIAASKGMPVDDKMSAKDQAELDRLRKLQGANFDREYVKSQLAAHKAAVALFDKESKSGNDRDLKQFAASTLPTLRDHLQLAQQLSKSSPRASAASSTRTAETKS